MKFKVRYRLNKRVGEVVIIGMESKEVAKQKFVTQLPDVKILRITEVDDND
jgi:hypothetical protein